jgi:hypothetical protein
MFLKMAPVRGLRSTVNQALENSGETPKGETPIWGYTYRGIQCEMSTRYLQIATNRSPKRAGGFFFFKQLLSN